MPVEESEDVDTVMKMAFQSFGYGVAIGILLTCVAILIFL